MAILNRETVSDLEHPGLQPYRSLRRRNNLQRNARFVVEGDKVVQRFLESRFPLESLLITPEWLDRILPLLDARPDVIQVFLAPKPRIEEVTGFSCYQGIKAVGRIDRPAALAEVLDTTPKPRLLAAMDGLANAENMGVIVRNAAALGIQALLIAENACSPFLTRAIRTSMGTVFRLPIVENQPLVEGLQALRHRGIRCLAVHPRPADSNLTETDLTRDCCLVFGSEGHGISPPVLAACDQRISIPMAREVDSLNVSSAAAILFYEARRQRGFA